MDKPIGVCLYSGGKKMTTKEQAQRGEWWSEWYLVHYNIYGHIDAWFTDSVPDSTMVIAKWRVPRWVKWSNDEPKPQVFDSLEEAEAERATLGLYSYAFVPIERMYRQLTEKEIADNAKAEAEREKDECEECGASVDEGIRLCESCNSR